MNPTVSHVHIRDLRREAARRRQTEGLIPTANQALSATPRDHGGGRSGNGGGADRRIANNIDKRTATQHKLTQQLRSIALGLIELCELAAAGLTPMRTPIVAQENANDSIRDQQPTHRPVQRTDPVRAGSATG